MTTRKKTTKKSKAATFLEGLAGGPLTFGKLLEATRLGEELTMAEFSKILKISVSHLNDIEKERKFVSPERAARFANILGYSEKHFVELALQDLLGQSGLPYIVEIKVA